MKRMTYIAVTLGLLVLIIVGSGVVLAKPAAVKIHNDKYVVTYQDSVVGWISINTKAWRYVLNVHGLTPDTEYWLIYEGRPGSIDLGTADANGGLHLQGELNPAPNLLTASPMFLLGTGPLPPATGSINLDGKECKGGWLNTAIFGTLSQDGSPLTGKTVYFYTYDPYTLDITDWAAGSDTTDNNGKFCKVLAAGHAGYSLAVEYDGTWDMNVETATTCPIC